MDKAFKKDSNKLLPNLLPPHHFQKHEWRPPSSLCTAYKGDDATFMAVIQQSLQAEMWLEDEMELWLASFTCAHH